MMRPNKNGKVKEVMKIIYGYFFASDTDEMKKVRFFHQSVIYFYINLLFAKIYKNYALYSYLSFEFFLD